MLRLTDDCLCHIFRMLSLSEQLIATAVCRRYYAAIVHILWRTRFRKLATISELTNKLSADEYKQFFVRNLVNLEKLTIIDTKFWASTSFFGRYSRPELVFYFKCVYPSLLELDCQDPLLDDLHVYLLPDIATKLRVLHLSSPHVTGIHMKDLRQLQQLYMPRSRLSVMYLREIFKYLKLTHLDITDNPAELCVGEALSPLHNCSLRELQFSEAGINEGFLWHFHKLLPNLRTLHVNNLDELHSRTWSTLLHIIAPRMHTLHLCNTSSYSTLLPLLTTYLDVLNNVRILHVYDENGISNVQAFWQLPSLRELHLAVPNGELPPAQKLLEHCTQLEHIYLIDFPHAFFTLMSWISSLSAFLKAEDISRPLLTVHAVDRSMHEMCKELKMTQQEKILKFETSDKKTSELHLDTTSVRFEWQ